MTIKEKFIEILAIKGVTEYKFYKETGVSRGTLSNKSGLNEDTIVKFFDYFPDIDANSIFKKNNSSTILQYSNEDSTHQFAERSEQIKRLNDNDDDRAKLIQAQERLLKLYEDKINELETKLALKEGKRKTGS